MKPTYAVHIFQLLCDCLDDYSEQLELWFNCAPLGSDMPRLRDSFHPWMKDLIRLWKLGKANGIIQITRVLIGPRPMVGPFVHGRTNRGHLR
jgi:hypothetical protein